jgi:hypothetical protein
LQAVASTPHAPPAAVVLSAGKPTRVKQLKVLSGLDDHCRCCLVAAVIWPATGRAMAVGGADDGESAEKVWGSVVSGRGAGGLEPLHRLLI